MNEISNLKDSTLDELKLRSYRTQLEQKQQAELKLAEKKHQEKLESLKKNQERELQKQQEDFQVELSKETQNWDKLLMDLREKNSKLLQEEKNRTEAMIKAFDQREKDLELKKQREGEERLEKLNQTISQNVKALHQQAQKLIRKEKEVQ